MKNAPTPGNREDRPLTKNEVLKIEEIHRHFPKHTHDEIEEALEDCQQELKGTETRDKILECMGTRLGPQAGDGVD